MIAACQALLAGCATEAELRQRDEAACTSYGFQRGTTEFATCLQRERLARTYGWGRILLVLLVLKTPYKYLSDVPAIRFV